MKLPIAAALCLALLVSFTACAPAAPAAPAETAQSAATEPVASAPRSDYDYVDVDLTKLSSTLVFSQTYNMLVDPTPYLGQVVRMSGSYIVYSDGARACLISDEGGCCQEGIHFSLQEGIPYPDLGTRVTVVGIFGTYYFNDVLYCRLYNAILE